MTKDYSTCVEYLIEKNHFDSVNTIYLKPEYHEQGKTFPVWVEGTKNGKVRGMSIAPCEWQLEYIEKRKESSLPELMDKLDFLKGRIIKKKKWKELKTCFLRNYIQMSIGID